MTTKELLGEGLESFKAILATYLNLDGSRWSEIENNLHSALDASISCKTVINEIVRDVKDDLEQHQTVSLRFLENLKTNKTTLCQLHNRIKSAIEDEEDKALELIKEIEALQ